MSINAFVRVILFELMNTDIITKYVKKKRVSLVITHQSMRVPGSANR